MAAVFPTQVSAAQQVGTYFVGQYYHILQQQPNLVYQFYTEASTTMRIDGASAETATGMMQIHSLIITLNFTGIEIKTAHSLGSWNGGVLVMVSGFVQTKDYNARRNFVQTFFLAPQEKGYFVLNDIFHLLDEEQMYQHPASILAQSNYKSNLITSNPIAEQVPDYMLGQEIQARDYVDPIHIQEIQARDYVDPIHTQEIQARDYVAAAHVEENDTIDKYSISEPPQQISECDDRVDEATVEEPIASFPSTMNIVREPPPAPADEPIGEQPKKTYASILLLSKGQSSTPATQAASLSKSTPVASDSSHAPQPTVQHSSLSTGAEKSNSEMVEVSLLEDEGEEKSVYVGNLPSSINESDLEHEFKNFGRIKPDGVAIRSRKESGGHYAFVEFEEVIGVKNALKASPILINGWQIYVEERKPNSGLSRGRRGRGRGGGYPAEAPRGRFGRSYGRVGGQDSSDREYISRTRANGVHQRIPRQERGILGNHAMRNGQNPSEAAY